MFDRRTTTRRAAARTLASIAASIAVSIAAPVGSSHAQSIDGGVAPPSRPGLPDPEEFLRHAQYQGVRLSPDGRRLAALVPVNGRSNLALIDLEHHKVVALTARTNDDVASFRWLGDRVVEVSVADLDEAGGVTHLHNHSLIDVVDQVELRDLQAVSRFGQATVLEALDPAGEDLVIETRDRSPSRLSDGGFVYGGFDAYRYNARTGKKQLLTYQSPGDVETFVSDRSGQVRVAVSRPAGGSRIVVSYRRSNEDTWTTLHDDPSDAPSFEPIDFDFDNRTLYVRVPAKERGGRRDVYAYDTETGKLGARLFEARTVDGGDVVFDWTERKAVGVRDDSPAGVAWLDPRWVQVQKAVDQALPDAHNAVRWARDDADHIVVTSESDTRPAVFYLLDRKTMQMERVAQSRPWLKEQDLSPRRLVRYTARDGLTIPAYVTMPKRPDGARPPLIVAIHGGPYVDGDRFGFDADAQFFASRGYATLQPNFRGTTGYGEAFEHAGYREWGLAMQDDVTDGVRWLVDSGQVDPDRVCLFGASYGGYATLWGLEKEPAMFRCGVAFLAVSDLELLIDVNWSDSNRYDTAGASAAFYKRVIGDPATDRDKMRAVSPRLHADRIQAPLLMAYGGADERVPIVHGNEMRSAMDRAHKPYEWVVYADQQHKLFSPENRADFYQRVDAFLAKNLAPRAPSSSAGPLPSTPPD